MTPRIYYFSGTGNSLAVARDLAQGLNGELVAIASIVDRNTIVPGSDIVGIVFPAYYVPFGGLPLIVKRFAARLRVLKSAYIFAVCTYGSTPARTMRSLASILRANGAALAARFYINMTENIHPELARDRHAIMLDT